MVQCQVLPSQGPGCARCSPQPSLDSEKDGKGLFSVTRVVSAESKVRPCTGDLRDARCDEAAVSSCTFNSISLEPPLLVLGHTRGLPPPGLSLGARRRVCCHRGSAVSHVPLAFPRWRILRCHAERCRHSPRRSRSSPQEGTGRHRAVSSSCRGHVLMPRPCGFHRGPQTGQQAWRARAVRALRGDGPVVRGGPLGSRGGRQRQRRAPEAQASPAPGVTGMPCVGSWELCCRGVTSESPGPAMGPLYCGQLTWDPHRTHVTVAGGGRPRRHRKGEQGCFAAAGLRAAFQAVAVRTGLTALERGAGVAPACCLLVNKSTRGSTCSWGHWVPSCKGPGSRSSSRD